MSSSSRLEKEVVEEKQPVVEKSVTVIDERWIEYEF